MAEAKPTPAPTPPKAAPVGEQPEAKDPYAGLVIIETETLTKFVVSILQLTDQEVVDILRRRRQTEGKIDY